MAHSSCTTSNVLIDLLNLPSLPDERRTTTMTNDFPHNFYLPDGKNSKISQIINKWILGRHTPDSNKGVGVEIPYLECAYDTKHYVVNKITGNMTAIHNGSIEPTDFFGHFGPFNLKELEFNVCRITDHHNGKGDSRLDDDRRWTTPNAPACYSQPNSDRCDHSMN